MENIYTPDNMGDHRLPQFLTSIYTDENSLAVFNRIVSDRHVKFKYSVEPIHTPAVAETTPTINYDEGRYLTGYDREIFNARQLYHRFDEGKHKSWFTSGVVYQLRTLANIMVNGNQDQRQLATTLHATYSRFILE